jgi:hypothetical protein
MSMLVQANVARRSGVRQIPGRGPRLLLFAVIAGLGWASGGRGEEPAVPTNTVNTLSDPVNEREAGVRVDAMIRAADAGEPAVQHAYDAAELGMAALWIAAARMNPDKPSHRAPLMLLAQQAATVSRKQRELLRLYDPPAYRAFHTPEGEKLQTCLAGALTWENPPPNMPAAMVLAAQEPTMAWLEAQDAQTLKNPKLLIEILQHWGSLVAMDREHQYLSRLQATAKRLTEAPEAQTNEPLLRAVLQFAGKVGCRAADDFAAVSLNHSGATVRGVAATTLGKLGGDTALQALADRVEKESDPAVQIAIADALLRWPKAPEAGDACVSLFKRAADANVRRAVLNTAGRAEWPAREPLLRRAFEAGDDTALIGLAAKAVPDLDDKLLLRLKHNQDQFMDPNLLDAVAAARIEDAIPVITSLLRREKNIAMWLKYAAALETIGGSRAGAVLLQLLDGHRDGLETEYVVTSLGRLRHEPAVTRLARMAKDDGVEIGIRVQAIWALGRIQNDMARSELDNLQQIFTNPSVGHPLSEDLAYHFRLVGPHLLLARCRADPASAGTAIERMFAEGGPIEQTTLLAGLAEQGVDHPVIAVGLESLDFSVFYMAITAARAAGPAKYGPRVRRLAASPYVRALEQISIETWDLKSLLSEGWR